MKHFLIIITAILCSTFSAYSASEPASANSAYEVPDNEEYICTVKGWNSANGENATIRIYLCHTPSFDFYVGREVSEYGVSSFSGAVKLVTNPDYQSRYKYYVKTGFIGAFFFNTDKLNSNYFFRE